MGESVSEIVWDTREAEGVGRGRERAGWRVPLTLKGFGRDNPPTHASRFALARRAHGSRPRWPRAAGRSRYRYH